MQGKWETTKAALILELIIKDKMMLRSHVCHFCVCGTASRGCCFTPSASTWTSSLQVSGNPTNQLIISQITTQGFSFPALMCREWWASLFWTSRHQLQRVTSDWSGEQTGGVPASWPPALCLPGADAVVNEKHRPSSTNSAVSVSFPGFPIMFHYFICT